MLVCQEREKSAMYQVLGVRKIENTEPQEFEIQAKEENSKEGYVMTTYCGTEPELRAGLAEAGMLEPDINRLFKQAS
jgi:hypothetical protein